MTERVSVGVADHVARRSGVTGEISASRRVAPRSLRIPVPRLDEKVRILPITDNSPACGKNFLNLIGAKENIRCVAGHSINGRSQGVKRAEFVHNVAGCSVNGDGLRCNKSCCTGQTTASAESKSCHLYESVWSTDAQRG